MSHRELEILARHLAKTNPPAVLHRYRRPGKWTLKELDAPEVHVASVNDMNDPFEYCAPLLIDMDKLRAAFRAYAREQLGMTAAAAENEAAAIGELELASLQQSLKALFSDSSLICTTSNPRSNRMWAYYAEGHKGICIGYSTNEAPFCLARSVSYADPDAPLDLLGALGRDPTLLSDHVSCRKGAEWSFEEEYRVPVGPIPSDHTRL